ncbi:hypothetical protein [Gemella cuniculi]|nr:hypothetical protein [Gemella cuniculi]
MINHKTNKKTRSSIISKTLSYLMKKDYKEMILHSRQYSVYANLT